MPATSAPMSKSASVDEMLLMEEEELRGLRESLINMDKLTVKTIDTIRSFDARLQRLETSIRPIHRATQELARQQEEVESSLLGLNDVIKYFDLAAREEQFILQGPQDDDIMPYLHSIGRVREAIQFLSTSGVHSGEKALVNLEKVLGSALKHLRELFRRRLLSSGQAFLHPREVDPELRESLSSLAVYLADAERMLQATDPTSTTTSYRRIYVDVRSKMLVEEVTNLASQSSIVDTSDRASYDRGSSDFIPFTHTVLSLLQMEQEMAYMILPEGDCLPSWADAVGPMMDLYTATGESIIQSAKRHLTTEVFRLFDLVDVLEAREQDFAEVLELAGKSKKVMDLVNSSRAISLASFPEYLMEIKTLGSKSMSVPEDGTVLPITSATLTHVKKLVEAGKTAERLLERLGDGNWRLQSKMAVESRRDSSLLSNYINDVLEALIESLTTQAGQYRMAPLRAVFLMNNIHHMLKMCRTTAIANALSPEDLGRLEGLVKQQQMAYQECWNGCIALLMDTTYIKAGAVKTSLGGAERQAIKDKFKSFNSEFDELHIAQKRYSIPDTDLRRDMISHIQRVLLPMYTRFLDKYRNSDFTKNHAKYIRYEADDLKSALNGFFDTRA